MPEGVRDGGGKLFMAAFLASVLFVLYRVFSNIWRRLRTAASRGATVELLPMRFGVNVVGVLMRALHYILRSLFPRWFTGRRRKEKQTGDLSSIRSIYRSLLHWAAEAGWPRQPGETPYEYLETLGGILPLDERSHLSYITEAYVITRYGRGWGGKGMLQQMWRRWGSLARFKFKADSPRAKPI